MQANQQSMLAGWKPQSITHALRHLIWAGESLSQQLTTPISKVTPPQKFRGKWTDKHD